MVPQECSFSPVSPADDSEGVPYTLELNPLMLDELESKSKVDFAEVLVDLLTELAAGAVISSIKGPPGSGKTDMAAFFCLVLVIADPETL